MKKIILITILILTSISIYSLQNKKHISQYLIRRYDRSNGLPQNSVKTITQTRDGYIWFGTQEGVVKYDGIKFKIYDMDFFLPVICRDITSIKEDLKKDVLWIGTTSGLMEFNYKTEKFKFHDLAPIVKEKNKNIGVILRDNIGNIWVISNLYSLKYKDGKFENLKKDHTIITSIANIDKTPYFAIDKKYLLYYDGKKLKKTSKNIEKIRYITKFENKILALSKNGFYIYNPKNNKFSLYIKFDKEKNPKYFSNLIVDRDKNIWLGIVREGVFKYYKDKNGKIYKDSLAIPMVRSIFEDKEGIIWIGDMVKGIFQLRDGKVTNITTKEGLSVNEVYPIYKDKDGEIIVGELGGGVFKIKNLKAYPIFKDIKNDIVITLDQTKDKTYWVVPYKKIMKITDKKMEDYTEKLEFNKVLITLLYVDSQDRIWINYSMRGIYLYDNKFNKLKEFKKYKMNIRSILEVDNKFWIGTTGQGILIVENDKIKKFLKIEDGLPSNTISSIYKNSQGDIMFGTENGLSIYKNGKFYNINKKNGLDFHSVADLIEDDDGNFWLSGNKGIIEIKKEEIYNFIDGKIDKVKTKLWGAKEGMNNAECNGGSQYHLVKKDGKLYFPTLGGVVVIDPKNIYKNKIKPSIYIENFIVDGKKIDINNKDQLIEIKKGSKKFEFHYTGLSFYDPKEIKFKYKLKGIDKNWVEAKNRRVAFYTNLEPGEYSFQVIAKNSDGVWNKKGETIKFKLIPKFSQTKFHRFLQILAIVLFISGIFYLRFRKIKQQKKDLERLIAEKTKELKEATLRDHLTGLRNRRFVSEIVNPEVEAFIKFKKYLKSKRNGRKTDSSDGVIGVYLCDIDYFKKVNDNYGHDVGDKVLKTFSILLKNCVRDDDFVIRWGGEEFLVILKNTDPKCLEVFIKRFRKKLKETDFIVNQKGDTIKKTASIGFIEFPVLKDKPDFITFEQAIILADNSLYYSKNNGRDRATRVILKEDLTKEQLYKLLDSIDKGVDENIVEIETII